MSGSGGNPLVLDLTVQYGDSATQGINSTTTALTNMGAAADKTTQAMGDLGAGATAAATTITAGTTKAAQQQLILQTATDNYNKVLAQQTAGLAQNATAFKTGQISAEEFAAAQDVANQKINDAQTKLDAASATVAKFGTTTTTVIQPQQQLSTAVANTTSAVNAQQKAATEHIASLGQQQFASRQLTVQFSQMFSGIASGQPILQTFIQQGHQIIDVAASTGTSLTEALGGALKTVGGLLVGPVGLVGSVAAMAAGIAYVGVTSLEAETAAAKLSVQLRATQADYTGAAQAAIAASKAFASTGGVSGATALQTNTVLANTPGFSQSPAAYAELDSTAKDLAAVLGVTLPQAAKTLSDAMKDPAAVADQLAKSGFPGFTQALVENIKQEEAAGDSGKALSEVLSTIQAQVAGAAEPTGRLADALKTLGDAYDHVTGSSSGSLWEDFKSFASQSVIDDLNMMANVLNSIANVQKWFDSNAKAGTSGISTTSNGAGIGVGGLTALQKSILAGQTANGVDAAGNSTQPGSGLPTGGNIQTIISAVASAMGMSSIVGQLTAIQQAENLNRQPDGTYANNGSHIGAFQISTRTYSGMTAANGYNINNQIPLSNDTQNTSAAAALWVHLLSKYDSPYVALLAWHDGETLIDKLIASGGDAGAVAGASPAAVAEANKVTNNPNFNFGGAGSSSGPVGPANLNSGIIDASQDIQRAQQQVAQANTLIAQIAANQASLDADKKLLATQTPGSTEYNETAEAIGKLNGQATQLHTSFDLAITSMKNANAPLSAQAGADRDIATALEQRNEEQLKANGQTLDAGQAAQVIQQETVKLTAAYNDNLTSIEQNTAATLKQVDAASQGGTAAQHAADMWTAYQEVQKTTASSSADFIPRVQQLAAALDAQAAAQQDVKNAADIPGQQQQLDMLNKQISLLGESADAQAKDNAEYAEYQKLVASGSNPNSATSQTLIGNAGAIAQAQTNLQQLQADVQAFQQIGTQAFDQVGTALVQAFTQGTSAGVSFGSTMKGILTSILEQILQLAVINPILNSITGGSSPTLGGYLLAQSGGGGSGGGSGITGIVGAAGTVVSAGSQIAGIAGVGGSSGGVSGISGSSGIVGNLQSLYSIGKGIYSGLSGGGFSTGIGVIDNVLNFQTGIGASTAGSVSGSTGIIGGSGGTFGAAGATAGDLIGGAGAGFALGSLLNQYVFKGNQTNGEIGAGVGAVGGSIAGAAIAGIPTLGIAAPIGALLGGLIGGTIGGAGGGLIGPKLPNYGYEVTEQAGANGLLGIAKSGGEGDPGGQAAQALAKQVSAYNDAFNQILAQAGIAASGSTILGANNYSNNGKGDAASGNAGKETTDLNSIFGNLSFSSQNPILNSALNNPLTKPQNITQLSAISDAFTDLAKTMGTLLNPLTGANDAIGSYGTALQNLNANYAQGIKDAQTLGMSTKALTDAQATADAALKKAAEDQVNQALTGYQERDLTATGQGGAATVLQNQQAAQAETAAFSKSLTDLYGTNFANTAEYAKDMAQLAQTQSDENNARIRADQQTYASTGYSLTEQTETAQGTPIDENTALGAFDLQAQQQVTTLQSSLSGMLAEGAISTQQYYAQITQLDQSLAAQRLQIDQQYVATAQQQLQTLQEQDESYQARQAAASGDQESADLINQSISGQQEMAALQTQITSYYGTGAQAQAVYAQQSAQLAATLAAEKIAIEQKYAGTSVQTGAAAAAALAQQEAANEEAEREAMNQAYLSVDQLFSSITSFAKSLATGALSPLSPDAQYAATNQAFQADVTGAEKGNPQALSDLTSAAQNFLQASQAVNGSGGQYLADYNAVVSVLQTIASSGVLSSAAMQTATQAALTGQQQSVAAIAALNAALTQLRAEIAQASAKPG